MSEPICCGSTQMGGAEKPLYETWPVAEAFGLARRAANALNEALAEQIAQIAPGVARHQDAVDGRTLLMVAADHGLIGLFKLLAPLSDMSARDNHGNTVLMFAAESGQMEIVDIAWPFSDARDVNRRKEDALMRALKSFETPPDLIERLAALSEPNRQSAAGDTAMTLAACQSLPHAARILAKAGWRVDAYNDLGLTPLLCAAERPIETFRAVWGQATPAQKKASASRALTIAMGAREHPDVIDEVALLAPRKRAAFALETLGPQLLPRLAARQEAEKIRRAIKKDEKTANANKAAGASAAALEKTARKTARRV